MRKTAFVAGLILCVPILLATSPHAEAEPTQIALADVSNISSNKVLQVVSAEENKEQETKEAEQPQVVAPVEHIVAKGETLSSIANQHQTTWKRLYDKNVQVTNPDVIAVGEKLTVPKADEQLAERALPAPAPAPKAAVTQAKPAPKAKSAARQATSRGSSSGNTYTAGYCTWYVKNKRPDLPNNLGNAYTWVERARAQGLPTGSTPRVGAAGQRGNHVVYVESVNGDGTVTISEMNHAGLYVVTWRTLPANYFSYIY